MNPAELDQLTTELNPCACPECAAKLELATSVEGRISKPRPEDISVCFTCGTVLQFTDKLDLIKATPETLSLLTPSQRFLVEAIRMVRNRTLGAWVRPLHSRSALWHFLANDSKDRKTLCGLNARKVREWTGEGDGSSHPRCDICQQKRKELK